MNRSEITYSVFKEVTKDDWFLDSVTEAEYDALADHVVVKLVNDAIRNPGTWTNGISVVNAEGEVISSP